MNSDSPMKLCKQCGQPMASEAPEGLCARCLLSAALKQSEASAAGSPSTPMPPAPEPAAIAPHFPQLEILELLGRGGMGMVYKARQPQLDRFVALKILPPADALDPEFAERFTREARTLARLNHPNIVSVYEFGHTAAADDAPGGLYFLLMEFVDGANLRQLLRTKSITPIEALAIVPRICEALQFAHEEGVTHRDIKPENILIDKKGRVKIADFGLAKIVGREGDAFTLTQAGMSLGTPRYMAPEQVENPAHVDHRADIYSLGVVFYEMLTGELPMGRFAPPSARAQVDVRLDEVVLRSLEKDVERRYQHASEVKSDVEDITGVMGALPAQLRTALGFEYKSERTWFGLPLVHITSGIDPGTGRRRVARGIVAIGDVAYGVIAMGGFATGGIAFGGVAVGGLAVGGVALGLVSLGGLALALLFASGGLAAGAIAYGGVALGWMAGGGLALGRHAWGGNARDPKAAEFFQNIDVGTLTVLMVALVLLASIVPPIAQGFARRAVQNAPTSRPRPGARPAAPDTAEPRLSRTAILGAIWAVFGPLSVLPMFLVTYVSTEVVAPGMAARPAWGLGPWEMLIAIPFVLLGIAAPFGATILGGVAIGQIKRSGGRLYGLPLAVADLLAYPLLIVAILTTAVGGHLVHALTGSRSSASVLPLLLVAVAVCFFIARAVWRKVAGEAAPTDASPFLERHRRVVHVLLWLIVVFGAVILITFEMRATHGGAGPARHSFSIGAVDPWFVWNEAPEGRARGVNAAGLNLATWSVLAGICAALAGAALFREKQHGEWRNLALAALLLSGVTTAGLAGHVMQQARSAGMKPLASAPPRLTPPLDEKTRRFEARIDGALAIRGDTERNNALAAIAFDAAGAGASASARRALERMSFVELRDQTAARCAQALAAHDLPAAIEIAQLIALNSLRDATLAGLTEKR